MGRASGRERVHVAKPDEVSRSPLSPPLGGEGGVRWFQIIPRKQKNNAWILLKNASAINRLPSDRAFGKLRPTARKEIYGRKSTTHHPPQQHRQETLRRPGQDREI